MELTPDLSKVSILDEKHGLAGIPDDIDSALASARQFILFYDWCKSIEYQYLGAAFDGIIYIFLFKIKSDRADVDSWIWVIVGDIPSAYLTCDDAATPYEALDSYVGAMEQWVSAAKEGKSVANLIPVNVPASHENGIRLEVRLKFIDEKILPQLDI
jgi:hypothetical protein